jgi:hypothetical protein
MPKYEIHTSPKGLIYVIRIGVHGRRRNIGSAPDTVSAERLIAELVARDAIKNFQTWSSKL